jgi:hypothetical protein
MQPAADAILMPPLKSAARFSAWADEVIALQRMALQIEAELVLACWVNNDVLARDLRARLRTATEAVETAKAALLAEECEGLPRAPVGARSGRRARRW